MSGVSRAEQATKDLPEALVGPVSLRDAVARALGQAVDDDLLGMAGELAYRGALVVLPFLVVLAALPSVGGSIFDIDNVGERLSREVDLLVSEKSAEMVNSLIQQVSNSRGWTPLLLGIIGTLWAGTSAISALRKSLNRIYKFDDQTPLVRRKATEAGLSLVTGTLLFMALVCVLLGPALMGGWNAGTQVVSLSLAFVLVLLAVSLIYWLAPAGDNQFRWITPGALVFGIAWLLFSLLFSAYLSRFATLNHVYGSLGAMIALLVWLYGSNAFLLFGAELNAVLAAQLDHKVPARRPEEPAAVR
jgi:membrane protein